MDGCLRVVRNLFLSKNALLMASTIEMALSNPSTNNLLYQPFLQFSCLLNDS